MTEHENVMVRVAILESLCISALTLYLANVRNDPDFVKSNALIDMIQKDAVAGIAQFPPEIRDHGAGLAKVLLDRLRRSLPSLRGGPAVTSH